VSSTTQLALLGKRPVPGVPFEMYRRGDVVLTMANSAIDGAGAELAAQPAASSAGQAMMPNGQPAPSMLPYSAQIAAIDVRDPARMQKIAAFEVPGEIADSRTVGDVLYVVSYENGQCWKCATTPRTVITSFDIANPTKLAQVDQISFTSDLAAYPAWKRSVTATTNRLYVAGADFNYDPNGNGSQSVIDVLDVSDPTGKIGVGAKLFIKGQILSRWQMDEHEGVLRVISQRDIAITRNGSGEPFVDTFKIQDSKTITPLGATTIKLPVQEALKSVRFDGTRAYAITFRNTDPLFTLDLSNPALPLQKGELQIPGFVHHIEPRGDRLIALGVDQGATTGSLNVSLFDVANMATPRMLSRVSFGAYNGLNDLTEDQNRIHKAFRVFDDQGLVVVPHTARYQSYYGVNTCDPSQGGIQLIDLGKNTLTLRALLEIPGTPRRALVQSGRLLAMSETNIRSFSLVSRDQSLPTADLSIAQCTIQPQQYPGGTSQHGGDYYPDGRYGSGSGYGWLGGSCN
jgi:Beta propeller domain